MDYDCGNRYTRKDGVGRARKSNTVSMCSRGTDGYSSTSWSRVQVLQVLENCGYGHMGAAKDPGSADFSGNTFHNGAS